MKIVLHKNFLRRYKKLTASEHDRFKKRRDLFLENPFHPLLYNHPLHGEYAGCRSFRIGGDLSVIYKETEDSIAQFVLIGTHAELYE
ncbi:MAG: hypothetical protein A3J58_01555 [Candidatus Sungbacteria bacterium RIFCSPHIGHO2_02_FULL_52_23]|uniref:Plasmid stabilization protein n=1 Tax=Candidatus Sungbacteria bacterium RIFCSPHIGHO2_02_FULL_52_23 TaxID=1802274 RepID=A0A1G2KSH7_9BACT|nr:MAG: hypothetical protein A3J58_01555 [Candidatus Sungbacteria bacterium RIFCSPHIGHO2_02_FULL_52_23]